MKKLIIILLLFYCLDAFPEGNNNISRTIHREDFKSYSRYMGRKLIENMHTLAITGKIHAYQDPQQKQFYNAEEARRRGSYFEFIYNPEIQTDQPFEKLLVLAENQQDKIFCDFSVRNDSDHSIQLTYQANDSIKTLFYISVNELSKELKEDSRFFLNEYMDYEKVRLSKRTHFTMDSVSLLEFGLNRFEAIRDCIYGFGLNKNTEIFNSDYFAKPLSGKEKETIFSVYDTVEENGMKIQKKSSYSRENVSGIIFSETASDNSSNIEIRKNGIGLAVDFYTNQVLIGDRYWFLVKYKDFKETLKKEGSDSIRYSNALSFCEKVSYFTALTKLLGHEPE